MLRNFKRSTWLVVFGLMFHSTLGNSTDINDNIGFANIIPSELVRKFLEHFKNPDSMNMPLPIPDPLKMPDHNLTLMTNYVQLYNMRAFGLHKIKLYNVTIDLVELKLTFGVYLAKMEMHGNYSYSNFFHSGNGIFNMSDANLTMECHARMIITRYGELEASDLSAEMKHHNGLSLNQQHCGWLCDWNIVSTFTENIFNTFTPTVLGMINSNVRGTLNERLKELTLRFPNSLAPIDVAMEEIRELARKMGYEPYSLEDYQYARGIYSFDITEITVRGMSFFYRLGEVVLLMHNSTIRVTVHGGTETLVGTCKWESGFAGLLTRSGTASFTVDSTSAKVSLEQSLDITKKPRLLKLKVRIGNFQLRMNGAGTLDYIMEASVNILPNLLRYQILQVAEAQVIRRIQDILDSLETEQIILDNLPILDEMFNVNDTLKVEDDGLAIPPNQLDLNSDLDLF